MSKDKTSDENQTALSPQSGSSSASPQGTAGNNEKLKSDFLKKFEMNESDDLHEEEDHDHIHVEGCCSCHSNVGN